MLPEYVVFDENCRIFLLITNFLGRQTFFRHPQSIMMSCPLVSENSFLGKDLYFLILSFSPIQKWTFAKHIPNHSRTSESYPCFLLNFAPGRLCQIIFKIVQFENDQFLTRKFNQMLMWVLKNIFLPKNYKILLTFFVSFLRKLMEI